MAPATGSFDAASGSWSGRLGLQVEDAPERSFSASFALRGNARAGALTLASPFGTTLAEATWSPAGATLDDGRGGPQRAFDSLDALVGHVTGTPVPVGALFDWLAGRATPVAGWEPDLRQQPEGRITARRTQPLPRATLRVVLDTP